MFLFLFPTLHLSLAYLFRLSESAILPATPNPLSALTIVPNFPSCCGDGSRSNEGVVQRGIREGKILFGEDAHPQEFPWIATIRGSSGENFCGAFAVTSRYLVTAAHCLYRKYNPHLEYEKGSVLPKSIQIYFASSSAQLAVETIHLHPQFEVGGPLNNDIALLRTTQKLNCTICLPEVGAGESGGGFTGDLVTVAGFGNTNCHNSKIKEWKLKKVSIPVWKDEECERAYRDAAYDFKREDYICAGDLKKDASKGDSGSPLMVLGRDGRWTAIGIVSAGRFMCEDSVPGVYTKISSYLQWIRSVIVQ